MAQRINQKNVTRKKKNKPYKLQWIEKWGSTWHFCYLALVVSLACGTLRLGKWIKEKDKFWPCGACGPLDEKKSKEIREK